MSGKPKPTTSVIVEYMIGPMRYRIMPESDSSQAIPDGISSRFWKVERWDVDKWVGRCSASVAEIAMAKEVYRLTEALRQSQEVVDAAPLDCNGRPLYLRCRVIADGRDARIEELCPTESLVAAADDSSEERFENLDLERIES